MVRLTITPPDVLNMPACDLIDKSVIRAKCGKKILRYNRPSKFARNTDTTRKSIQNLFPRDMEQLLMRVVLVLYALEDDEKDKQPFHNVIVGIPYCGTAKNAGALPPIYSSRR